MNRVAGIRTDPGLSNSQLADDPILERSAAHQPPWDPRMHACICPCVSALVPVCTGMWLRTMYLWAYLQARANTCVYVSTRMCSSERKVGLSEIKHRLPVLHVPCLKTSCDQLGHKRRME